MKRHTSAAETIAYLRRRGSEAGATALVGAALLFAFAGALAGGGGTWLPDILTYAGRQASGSHGVLRLGWGGLAVGVALGVGFGLACALAARRQWEPVFYAHVRTVLLDHQLLQRVLDENAYEQLSSLGISDARRSNLRLLIGRRKPAPQQDSFSRRMHDLVASFRNLSQEIGAPGAPPGYGPVRLQLALPAMVFAVCWLLFGPGRRSRPPLIHWEGWDTLVAGWPFQFVFLPVMLACIGVLAALEGSRQRAVHLALADLLDGSDLEDETEAGHPVAQALDPPEAAGDGTGWG